MSNHQCSNAVCCKCPVSWAESKWHFSSECFFWTHCGSFSSRESSQPCVCFTLHISRTFCRADYRYSTTIFCWSVLSRVSDWVSLLLWRDETETQNLFRRRVCSCVDQWISRSVNQWLIESVDQWNSGSMKQWTSKSVVQWISESVAQWNGGSVNQWFS